MTPGILGSISGAEKKTALVEAGFRMVEGQEAAVMSEGSQDGPHGGK